MIDLSVNIQEAIHELTCKPIFATSAERVLIMNEIKSKYRHLPQPLRFGTCLQELLSRVSVPLEAHDLVAGRCVDRELTEEEETLFQAFLVHPDYPRRHIFIDNGHCTYSWESVIELGLPGLKERAIQRREEFSAEEDKVTFLTGMIMAYEAIESYMLRYADAADAIGNTELAAALRRGATQKDNDFYSGLQLLYTIEFIMCAYICGNPTLTLGRIDQLLYPAYRRGIEDGSLTREKAAALITDFYCKHNLNMGRGEHQNGDATNSTTFDRIFNFDAPQYMQLGGLNAKKECTVNELTYLFAECIQPGFKNPVVVFQYTKGLDQDHPELWKTIVKKALESSALMIYNDNAVVDCMLRLGFPIEDVVQHAHYGCNWPSLGPNVAARGPETWQLRGEIPDEYVDLLEKESARIFYHQKWIEAFMDSLRDFAQIENPESIEPLYKTFWGHIRNNLEGSLYFSKLRQDICSKYPSKFIRFSDCFWDCSRESGMNSSASGKYTLTNTTFSFFATVVDCFITTEKLVLLDKKITAKELLDAVDANYEGYPDILAMCRNVEKFGSDTPYTNAWANRISEDYFQLLNSYHVDSQVGSYRPMPCLQCDTNHIKVGAKMGATPDGRLAGAGFSQNSRPANGSCTNGMTGMLNSLLSLSYASHCSGALNLDVDPKQFAGETGEALFRAILANYFNRGGLHAQISSTCVEDLLEAQLHPEEHRDLRVRVTGYSGVFVDICKKLQDDIIERFK